MDKEVFMHPEVADFLNTSFINYKVNAEGSGSFIASKYGVSAYPQFLFIHADESLFGDILGGMTAERFLKKTEDIFYRTEKGAVIHAFGEAWKTREHTPELVIQYFHLRRSAGLDNSTFLEQWLSELHEDSLDLPHNERILMTYTTRTDGQAFTTICRKQNGSPRYSNKINALLEKKCKEVCLSGSEKQLDTLMNDTQKAFQHIPHKMALRQAQFKHLFYLENNPDKKYVSATETFMDAHFFPLVKNTAHHTDSLLVKEYLAELSNIAWQYSNFITKKAALKTAAAWLEQTNQIVGESPERNQYIVQLLTKAGARE